MTTTPIESTHLCRLLRRTRHHRLTLGQIQILSSIMSSEGGSLQGRDIARQIGTSHSCVSEGIAALEQSGLIQRDPVLSDRRSVIITLSDLGKTTLTDILSA